MFCKTRARLRTYARDDTAGQLKALHEDGFALIPGVLELDAPGRRSIV
jgi:hypothetical protein